ncbi:MAG: hypothetical protein KF745_05275 [Phycisphaeraceae bacterium]|nr:hypothetical protein [Phycisphaeraceae bacterium]
MPLPPRSRLARTLLLASAAAVVHGLFTPALTRGEPPHEAPPPAPPSKPASTPASPPRGGVSDAEVDQVIADLERAVGPSPLIKPVLRDGAPVFPSATPKGASRLLPEGTFLPSRRGRVVRAADRAVFVFDPTTDGAESPMILLPGAYLAAMERSAEQRGADTKFVITGQVFAFKGRNYLLPTSRPVAEVGSPDAATASQNSTAPAMADPELERIVADLEKERGGGRTAEPLQLPSMPRDSARKRLSSEGTLLTMRRGRVVRSGAGDWAFVVDADTDSPAEAPLVLQPCLILEDIERIARTQGESATITLSGQVFVYRERNYIMPTMFWVNRPSEGVIPTQ